MSTDPSGIDAEVAKFAAAPDGNTQARLAVRAISTAASLQDYPGPRLFVDGLEFPLPATADVELSEANALHGHRVLTVTIPVTDAQIGPEFFSPQPAQIADFTGAVADLISVAIGNVPAEKRKADLVAQTDRRWYSKGLVDGMEIAIEQVQALAAKHLAP